MLDADVIIEGLGQLGRGQVIISVILYYSVILAGVNSLASVFVAHLPHFRCNVQPLSDYVPEEVDVLNYTTPFDSGKDSYDGCRRYGYNLSECTADLSCVDKTASTIKCDQGYYYDRSLFTETVVTEFDLVCDRYNLIALSTSMFQVGNLVGSLVFGNFADKYGRKVTCVITYFGALACSFGGGYSNSVETYMVLRALTAAFSYGTTLGSFVYVMELVNIKWRTPFGIGYQIFFPIGYMIQSGVAYKWRDWHDIMLVCNLISTPFLLFALIIPESPRWLFTANKTSQGKKVVKRIARFNGTQLSEDLWVKAEIKEDTTTKEKDEVTVTYTTLDLFRHPGSRLVTLNVMFSWFVNSLVYYGISLNAGSLAGDIFLNNTLNGVMEIASYILAVLLLDRLGRRITLAGGFLLASIGLFVSLIMVEFTDHNQNLEMVGVVFAFVGKIGISGSFAIIYNMTSELFPTVTRSSGVGTGSVAARIGGIAAPFIISLQTYVRWLPNTIFGVLGLLAAATTFAFPETNGCKMLETIEEAEYFYKHGKPKEDIHRDEETGKDNKTFETEFDQTKL